MSEDQKPVWPWIVAVLIVVPVLYILSSGPARSLMMHRSVGSVLLSGMSHTVWVIDERRWTMIYAPLDWAANHEFGAPLERYWELFPIPDEP